MSELLQDHFVSSFISSCMILIVLDDLLTTSNKKDTYNIDNINC